MKNRKIQLFEFLYEKCREDPDLLATTVDEYINLLSDSKLDELEDLLVNNFSEYQASQTDAPAPAGE